MEEEIYQRVKNVIVDRMYVDASEVQPETNLQNDLGVDSLDAVEIVIDLEKDFNIRIPDEKMYTIETCRVRDVCDLVENLLAAK